MVMPTLTGQVIPVIENQQLAVFNVFNSAVSRTSVKQKRLTLSSTEAEYVAMSQSISEVVRYEMFLMIWAFH